MLLESDREVSREIQEWLEWLGPQALADLLVSRADRDQLAPLVELGTLVQRVGAARLVQLVAAEMQAHKAQQAPPDHPDPPAPPATN